VSGYNSSKLRLDGYIVIFPWEKLDHEHIYAPHCGTGVNCVLKLRQFPHTSKVWDLGE